MLGLAVYVALLVLAFRRLLRGARGAPARAAIAAGFAALVLHTWLYAAFLEDPVTWTLLALGSALAAPVVARALDEEDAAASLNGHRKEPVVVARHRAVSRFPRPRRARGGGARGWPSRSRSG